MIKFKEKMMVLVLILLIGFAFVSCNNDDNTNNKNENSNNNSNNDNSNNDIGNINNLIWEQLKNTEWEKESQHIKFTHTDGTTGMISCIYGPGNSSGAIYSGIWILTTNKIIFGNGNYSFNFAISGNTLTVTNWSISENATNYSYNLEASKNMNGVYTRKN